MEFSPDDFRAMMTRAALTQGSVPPSEALKLAEASSDDTLFNAIAKLGLRLQPASAPIEILVIDQALKTPTEN